MRQTRYLVAVITAALGVVVALAGLVRAQSPSLVISELGTGSKTSASEEFVELYNPTASDIDVTGYTLDYKSATAVDQPSSWSKHATLAGVIKSHGFYLVATSGYLAGADASWSATMAASGGHVRLRAADGSELDRIGWGSANASEGQAAAAPSAGQSLERGPGDGNPTGGNSIDSDNNANDFVVRTSPEPQNTASAIEEPNNTITTTVDPGPTSTSTLNVEITELLVDPAAPLTDANEEFIELHNAGSAAADLSGYKLRCGSSFHSSYTLPAGTILAPGQYLAFKSSQTKLALTNSGGAAQFVDPSGAVLSQTANYEQAPTGASWELDDDTWGWSTTPTPNAANVYTEATDLSAAGATATKAKSSKTTTISKKSSAAKTGTKSTKVAAAKASKSNPATVLGDELASSNGAWLLAGLATLTIGYGIYEYRHKLYNYYLLSRRYLQTRRAGR